MSNALMTLEKEYRGFNYEIEVHENGANYNVFEFTPIAKKRVDILFGSSCNQDQYCSKYVENLIDEFLGE